VILFFPDGTISFFAIKPNLQQKNLGIAEEGYVATVCFFLCVIWAFILVDPTSHLSCFREQ
jgi:hypothetical protein